MSFIRQLNAHGFKKNDGLSIGENGEQVFKYWHKNFIREQPDNWFKVQREGSRSSKKGKGNYADSTTSTRGSVKTESSNKSVHADNCRPKIKRKQDKFNGSIHGSVNTSASVNSGYVSSVHEPVHQESKHGSMHSSNSSKLPQNFPSSKSDTTQTYNCNQTYLSNLSYDYINRIKPTNFSPHCHTFKLPSPPVVNPQLPYSYSCPDMIEMASEMEVTRRSITTILDQVATDNRRLIDEQMQVKASLKNSEFQMQRLQELVDRYVKIPSENSANNMNSESDHMHYENSEDLDDVSRQNFLAEAENIESRIHAYDKYASSFNPIEVKETIKAEFPNEFTAYTTTETSRTKYTGSLHNSVNLKHQNSSNRKQNSVTSSSVKRQNSEKKQNSVHFSPKTEFLGEHNSTGHFNHHKPSSRGVSPSGIIRRPGTGQKHQPRRHSTQSTKSYNSGYSVHSIHSPKTAPYQSPGSLISRISSGYDTNRQLSSVNSKNSYQNEIQTSPPFNRTHVNLAIPKCDHQQNSQIYTKQQSYTLPKNVLKNHDFPEQQPSPVANSNICFQKPYQMNKFQPTQEQSKIPPYLSNTLHHYGHNGQQAFQQPQNAPQNAPQNSSTDAPQNVTHQNQHFHPQNVQPHQNNQYRTQQAFGQPHQNKPHPFQSSHSENNTDHSKSRFNSSSSNNFAVPVWPFQPFHSRATPAPATWPANKLQKFDQDLQGRVSSTYFSDLKIKHQVDYHTRTPK